MTDSPCVSWLWLGALNEATLYMVPGTGKSAALGALRKAQRAGQYAEHGGWPGGRSGNVYRPPAGSERETVWATVPRLTTWRSPNGVDHLCEIGRPCYTCGRATVPTVAAGHGWEGDG